MNIGFLSESLPYLPSRDGFRTYGGNVICRLQKRHRIDLVSLMRDDDERHLDWPRQFCRSIQTIPARAQNLPMRGANLLASTLLGKPLHYRRAIAAILSAGIRERGWDVLHVEGGFIGGLVPTGFPLPKVLSIHDSWTLRCDEMLKCNPPFREKTYYRLLRLHQPRYQRLVYPRFGRCVVVADRDRNELNRVAPRANVATIPYGTDLDYFHPLPVRKDPLVTVFHGNLAYAPNIAAALEYADRIFPIIRAVDPRIRFRIVAAAPVAEIRALAERPGIELIESPPDVRPPVCSSAIYVCPIQHGTGMKTKMLEAMAMRMPIVCYAAAAAGLDYVPGTHFCVEADQRDFASRVLRLLNHQVEAEAMAARGRGLVEEKYGWDARVQAFEDLYGEVIVEHRAACGTEIGQHLEEKTAE